MSWRRLGDRSAHRRIGVDDGVAGTRERSLRRPRAGVRGRSSRALQFGHLPGSAGLVGSRPPRAPPHCKRWHSASASAGQCRTSPSAPPSAGRQTGRERPTWGSAAASHARRALPHPSMAGRGRKVRISGYQTWSAAGSRRPEQSAPSPPSSRRCVHRLAGAGSRSGSTTSRR